MGGALTDPLAHTLAFTIDFELLSILESRP